MKRFAGLVCAVAAIVFFASCSKDKESGSLSFDSPAVFLSAGQTVTVGFKSVNLQNLSVTNKPTGWSEPTIDVAAQTLTITAPGSFDDDEVKTGSVVLAGSPKGGSSVSATLFVGVVDSKDMSAEPANSYIVNKPECNYLFDAMHKGDGKTSLATASVDVVWQSKSGLIQYTELRDGKVSFYVGADSDDEEKIKEGNAVIGAYDAGGTMIWSWHIWAVNYDPDTAENQLAFNGYTMMNRNLGALNNDNSTTDKILASYGLYYQWGRKDPFIGPSSYNAANGASASMYNGGGSRVYMKTEVSSADAGTMDYAVRNPLTFIVGVSDSEYDWLWSAHSDGLWSDTKTVNDPCPYGWCVAPSVAFDNLFIQNTPEAGDADKFGWTLYGPQSGPSLFIGAGRRIYRHIQEDDTQGGGSIQNFYPTPIDKQVRSSALYNQPWVGYYWTTGTAAGTKSSALYFWFDKSNPANSSLENNTPQYRANGMQVRCVKAN
ncbi:hypothetical protein [Alistipes sp.]|uniref:hypothetical protein n=1 Tax=Alistipes sp. TaxID=1872444 RepID=UPI003AB27D5D